VRDAQSFVEPAGIRARPFRGISASCGQAENIHDFHFSAEHLACSDFFQAARHSTGKNGVTGETVNQTFFS